MLKKTTLIFIITLSFFGCSKYQRLLKSPDMNKKYDAAVVYFTDEKYDKALPLLEELMPLYRATDKAERVYYYYCYTNFNLDLLYASAYHFKKYSITYPLSEHAEKALFMSAYSNYLMSPLPTLDPTDTQAAINSLQLFINTFPDNALVDSSNVLNIPHNPEPYVHFLPDRICDYSISTENSKVRQESQCVARETA